MTPAARHLLLLPPLLLLLLLLLQAHPALGARRLSECPRDTLALEVPEDLPAGSTLFSWDPARLSVTAKFYRHHPTATRPALSLASAGARAFFGIDFAISAVPGQPRVALSMPLPAVGSDKLHSHVLLNCTAANGGQSTRFHLELRLVRSPLRLLVEPHRPRPSRWAPAGTVVASVVAFHFGSRVSPGGCTADAKPRSSGRPLTVRPDGSIALAAPPQSDETEDEWTFTVTCERRGRRASQSLTVAPLRLWRRRFNKLHVAASDSGAALAGASLQIRLGPLLLSQSGLRVRLTASSHPTLARLEPAGPTDPVGSVQLDLPSDGQPLTLTLEAANALGSSEVTRLRVSSGRLHRGGGKRHHRGACSHPPAAGSWWPAPVLSATVAAAAVAMGAVALACVCLSRRRRHVAGVKPQFV